MIGRATSFLGLAVSDQVVACAEVSSASVRRTAVFVFPPDATLDQPAAAGEALAKFLRQKGFTANRAVAGVPARWLIAVEKEVPPADEEQTRALLRLQAERLAVAESGEIVFDFAGRASSSGPTKVLLVGMLRQRMEKVEQMLEAAGMTPVAITSSGLALANAATRGGANADGGVVVLGRGGGEIVWRQGGTPRMLRHVSVITNGTPDSADVGPLGSELRRAVMTAQQNGSASATNRHLLLLDGLGLAKQDLADLSTRAGIDLRAAEGPDVLGIQNADPESAGRPTGALAPAMSLALAGARPELLAVDFKHSRLTLPPQQRVSRRMAWIIGVSAAFIVGMIALFVSIQNQQSELDDLNKKVTGLRTAPSPNAPSKVNVAQAALDRLKYGRGFFPEGRPAILECLMDITQSFRDDERIWATGFKIAENGRGQLTGKAADQKTILAVLDRLKKQKRLSGVTIVDSHESDSRSHEWTYTIGFNFDLTAKAE
jgi:hypothetical protein